MTAVILKIVHPFKYPELRVMSSKQMKTSFTNCPACLLAEMAKVASLVAGPHNVHYMASYKAPLYQSDCWKLFVQLWNYTKTLYKPLQEVYITFWRPGY